MTNMEGNGDHGSHVRKEVHCPDLLVGKGAL